MSTRASPEQKQWGLWGGHVRGTEAETPNRRGPKRQKRRARAPKASMGRRGCVPLLNRLWGLGEHRELPQLSSGQSLGLK